MRPRFRDVEMDPPTMDERLKNAAIRGDVGFLREAIDSKKPFEYFKLNYVPRDDGSLRKAIASENPFEYFILKNVLRDGSSKDVGGNMFHLAAINGRVEFIREALEALPFSVVHELLKHWRYLSKEYEQLVHLIEDFYERHNPMDRHLKNAAIQGDVEFLKQAVASDRPVEYFKSMYFRCPTRNENGGNIFHLAAHHGRVEFFKAAMEILLPISEVELDILLWQRGDDIHSCVGTTVLDVADRKCHEILRLIEEIYRGRNSMDEQLKNAAIEGDEKFLREAVGPNVNKPNAYFQSLCCVPDPNYWKDWVGNMFHLAAWNKREEFLREAMEILPKEAGVDVHLLLGQQDHPKFKRNPLHVAASEGYNKIVKVILDYYHRKSLISAPAMDCRSGVKPWLVKDERGYTPFYYVMDRCREECALKLLSIDSELFSHMDDCAADAYSHMEDCTADDPYYSIFVIALRRGFSKVILKFLKSAPDWDTFDKRVLACALGAAPNCSDEIFRLVLDQNLQVIKDRDFYRIWSPLASWVSIGKLYPFEYVLLKEEVCATDLRRYIVDMISKENPLCYVAESDCDEDRGVQIATILVDAWEKERGQLNAVKFDELPWFARRKIGGTVLDAAIVKRREKVALHFLSLEKIELFLGEGGQSLFLAMDHQCHDVAQKILDLVDQHGLKTLLTSSVGRTVLHNAPKCKEDFLKQLVKRYPELMKQTDDDGVTVLHSWMKIGKLWAFQCILNKDEFSLNVRKDFASLLQQKTDDKSWNPLHVAAAVGANGVIEHIVRFALEAIAEQNSNFLCCSAIEGEDIEGNTAVDIALSTGREELALCFLSMGIPSACNYIFKAIDKQCHSVVKFLLGEIHKGGWAHHLHKGKQNLLHVASKCTEENGKLIVERWPELINEQDEEGKTPLERASEAGANWLVELILQKDRSCILNTPLAWVEACKRGHLSTVFAFVEKSSYFMDLCHRRGETPLHHIQDVHFKEYKALLDHEFIKELKNTQNSKGETPLHVAITSKNKDFAEILLRMDDVDRTIKDHDGKTAMELLEKLCNQDDNWKRMCEIIGVDPRLRTTYIHLKADLTHMRDIISLVAALLATITFTAGFTLPGGFDSDSGEAILVKKAAFLMFLMADGYAMCTSMLVLFCIIWSMVCKRQKSSLLIDRSLVLLKQSLYGTLLAFMTGVYTVIHRKSLWAAIVIFVMCSLVVVTANRSILHVVIPKLIPADDRDYLQWLCCWKKRKPTPGNQSEVQEREPLNNQCQSELDSIV